MIRVEKSVADEVLGRNVVRIFRHLDQLDAKNLCHEDQIFIARFKRYTMNDYLTLTIANLSLPLKSQGPIRPLNLTLQLVIV